MEYEEWMKEVNDHLEDICDFVSDDLADAPYYDHYETGTTARDMAEIVLVDYNDYPPELVRSFRHV